MDRAAEIDTSLENRIAGLSVWVTLTSSEEYRDTIQAEAIERQTHTDRMLETIGRLAEAYGQRRDGPSKRTARREGDRWIIEEVA